MAISSYYIAKDKETFHLSMLNNKVSADSKKKPPSGIGFHDVNLNGYSHKNVDRFAVLLDIWTNEVNFLEMKRNVIYITN